MKKTEVISELLKLYDELDMLRKTVAWLSNENSTNIQNELIRIGEEKMFNDGIRNWYKVEVEKDGSYTPYDKWLEYKVFRLGLDENISYNEFVSYFEIKLKELYEKELAECKGEVEGNE